MLTTIRLLITARCPNCGIQLTEDFLTTAEIKCSTCQVILAWADVLTDDEHNALDTAEEFLTPINPESIWTLLDEVQG